MTCMQRDFYIHRSVCLQLGRSVCFPWFWASRIIKHLQHNQVLPSKWRREWRLQAWDWVSATDHSACYHDNAPKCSPHGPQPSASPHWIPPPPLLSASLGVWGIQFDWSPPCKTDHMTNQDVSEISLSSSPSSCWVFSSRVSWAALLDIRRRLRQMQQDRVSNRQSCTEIN